MRLRGSVRQKQRMIEIQIEGVRKTETDRKTKTDTMSKGDGNLGRKW